jgi:hypothetical protein
MPTFVPKFDSSGTISDKPNPKWATRIPADARRKQSKLYVRCVRRVKSPVSIDCTMMSCNQREKTYRISFFWDRIMDAIGIWVGSQFPVCVWGGGGIPKICLPTYATALSVDCFRIFKTFPSFFCFNFGFFPRIQARGEIPGFHQPLATYEHK